MQKTKQKTDTPKPTVDDKRKEMKEFEEKHLPPFHWLKELPGETSYNSCDDVPDEIIIEEYIDWKFDETFIGT